MARRMEPKVGTVFALKVTLSQGPGADRPTLMFDGSNVSGSRVDFYGPYSRSSSIVLVQSLLEKRYVRQNARRRVTSGDVGYVSALFEPLESGVNWVVSHVG